MKWPRAVVVCLVTLVAASASAQDVASPVSAQDRDHGSFLGDVVKQVALDPTTYAPAIMAWGATRLDWRSSQVFFRNGYYEHNPRFTVSGLPDDTAIGYADGNRKISIDAVANLQFSLLNNFPERVIERLLIRRYPQHRKLLRTIGWIERSVAASYWAYRLSAGHLRQWQENERRARRLGYR